MMRVEKHEQSLTVSEFAFFGIDFDQRAARPQIRRVILLAATGGPGTVYSAAPGTNDACVY